MTPFFRRILVPVLILILTVTNFKLVEASRGMPSTPEFGFGAVLYPNGPAVQEALDMAADLGLDWITVPVTWADYQPAQSAPPALQPLDNIMAFAAQHQIDVLISLSGAPGWAQTSLGPDPAQTARFAALLYQRYPSALRALELFPAANTRAGWGGQVSAAAYTRLLQQVTNQLHDQKLPMLLIAGGLRPLAANPAAGDIEDVQFLKDLYQQGAASLMPILSLQLHDLTGDPLTFPDGSRQHVLRHYEEIRQIMVANHHQNGVIWITQISQYSGTIKASDSALDDITLQANWMTQVYIQTRSQLYVGVNIMQSLNSGPEGAAAGVPCLLMGNGAYHPFYAVLRDMISLNKTGGNTIKLGKPKEGILVKNRP